MTDLWLAIVEPRHSWLRLTQAQRDEILALPALTGISVRVPTEGSRDVAAEVIESGKALEVEGWATEMGRPDPTPADAADGALAGARFATLTDAHGARVGRTNPERPVWGDDDPDTKLANPWADDYLDAFATAFYEHSSAGLAYLGLDPDWNYDVHNRVDADGDGFRDDIIPPRVMSRFSAGWHRMAYSARLSTLLKQLASARRMLDTAVDADGEPMRLPLGFYFTPPRQGKGNLRAVEEILRRRLVESATAYIGMDQHADDSHLLNPWTTLFGGREPLVAWLEGLSVDASRMA